MLQLNRKFATCGIAALVLAALPANAIAGETFSYVDEDSANNTPPCTQANPCREIGVAENNTNSNGTIFVDGGSYGFPTESTVVLDSGRSLIYEENSVHGVPDAPAIIDGGSAQPAVQVNDGTTAGTIQGFTLRGATRALDVRSTVTITGNTFDDDIDPGAFASLLLVGGNGDTFTVSNNDFADPTANDEQYAIRAGMLETSHSVISGNTINGFRKGIEFTGTANGTQTVNDNTITGTHSQNPLPGIGIWVEDVSANLTHNLIQQPGAVPDGSLGITAFANTGTGSVHVTLARNQVYNQTYGVDLTDTSTATLNGDVIANNSGPGLNNKQTSALNPGLGDTTARNVTVWANGTDVGIDAATLTLTSSIVEDAIAAGNSTGDMNEDPACTITASRGPLMSQGTNFGCDDFQTTAAPGFVDPTTGVNNFHLTTASPMIDMGSTIDPPPGTLDVDGNARVLDGNCDGTARADIGADELVRDCSSPVTPSTPPPLVPASQAQGPTGQRGAAMKKCKKKRSKQARKKCRKKAQQLPV